MGKRGTGFEICKFYPVTGYGFIYGNQEKDVEGKQSTQYCFLHLAFLYHRFDPITKEQESGPFVFKNHKFAKDP